jgi:predicted AAA+ superfamily ATPase
MVENLLKYNRHWEKGFYYPYNKKREILSNLLNYLDEKQIIELVGLRRVGKTTLLFQVINNLLDKGLNPLSILYFTFDEETPSIDDLLASYSYQTQIDFKKEKIYIFLDEIQKLSFFQNQLKVYYDLYPNLKFFISGSTSLFIKKKTQESLAGRVSSFFLKPLNFSEYLYFIEKSQILDKPLIYRKEIEKEFEIFLSNQFIESIEIKDSGKRKEYYKSIIRKIIFEDIPAIFSIENPEILWRVIQIIGQKPGMIIDYQNLSRDLGISNKTLSSYFFYLEESFLVKKVYNFSSNLLTSEKKLKKFYLSSPSFCTSISDFIEKGNLVENLVISLKDYNFFWRDAYQHEVDFVFLENSEAVPVEVKYKEKIYEREFKNLEIFSRKFKLKKALCLWKNINEEKINLKELIIEKKSIYFL